MITAPLGWKTTQLGAILELVYGKSLPAKQRDGGDYPVFGSNGVVGQHSVPLVHTPGLIIGRKGSFGEVHISKQPFFPIDTTYYVDKFYGQPIRYWFYQLKLLPLNQLNRATAIPGLNRDDAYSQNIALPPLAEQKVIADKLDSLLAQVESTKARLDRIPQILKRFRQSVLAAAVSGRLTEEFHTSDKYVDVTDQYSVPHSWNFVKLGELSELVTSGSRGWAKYYSNSGSLFIRSQDINTDELDITEPCYVDLPKNIEGQRTRVQECDLLVTITGANVTKCALVKNKHNDAYVSQHVSLIRLNNPSTAPFVECVLKALNAGRYQLQKSAYGGGKPGLNLQNIKDVSFAMPDLEEMAVIVRRVDQLFAYADRIEQQVNNALERVNNLTQSILAKAFRGELTEQWRRDNPELISGDNSAEALLERIKAERAAMKPAKRGRKKASA